MKSLQSWVEHTRRLIAPSLQECLFCGHRAPPSSGLPGICQSCQKAVPWIRSPRCLVCGRHVGCPDCSRSHDPLPIVCNRSAVAYTSGMRELLGQYKYRGNESLGPVFGLMLDKAYSMFQQEQRESESRSIVQRPASRRFLSAARRFSQPVLWHADLLVPVPVSAARLSERGFNQAEQMAGVLSQCRRVPQLPLLVRTHHTGKQSFKSRRERLADMQHAFTGNTDPEVLESLRNQLNSRPIQFLGRPLQIIIVDDIYTTGSTIRACATALHQLCGSLGQSAEIYSLTWARS